MLVIHNNALLDRLGSSYELFEIRGIQTFLSNMGVFDFPALGNGLFPAANLGERAASESGYQDIWVRDNVHIAHAHYVAGDNKTAVKNALALTDLFRSQEDRLMNIIQHRADCKDILKRPHVRYRRNPQGWESLEKWAHAQNDALGYFLWFQCRLALDGALSPEQFDPALIALFPRYFDAIQFWQDEDSGHWEETRKVSASSIGVVVGALELLRKVLISDTFKGHFVDQGVELHMLHRMIDRGRVALDRILPAECMQPGKERKHDAALLFLIYPIDVVSEQIAQQIVRNVERHLRGDYGIRRYVGDSYWFPNYKRHYGPGEGTADFSNEIETRDVNVKEGQEAQWCVFDPIVSVIFGRKFLRTGDRSDLQKQTDYLNRSLGQLTGPDFSRGPFLCPEAYYQVDGGYEPNDHTPLLWTQANLWTALHYMERSLAALDPGAA